MDLKEKLDEIVDKVKGDPQLLAKFKDDPVAALEGVLGINLPDEQMKPLVAAVRAKLEAGNLGDALGKLKKLF